MWVYGAVFVCFCLVCFVCFFPPSRGVNGLVKKSNKIVMILSLNICSRSLHSKHLC